MVKGSVACTGLVACVRGGEGVGQAMPGPRGVCMWWRLNGTRQATVELVVLCCGCLHLQSKVFSTAKSNRVLQGKVPAVAWVKNPQGTHRKNPTYAPLGRRVRVAHNTCPANFAECLFVWEGADAMARRLSPLAWCAPETGECPLLPSPVHGQGAC
ncbi:MAG: hypothetical protein J3K34DRAFT_153948 [Monoraphidium minutum]|nr:MAG: hypothetical protein J3K34DRAFT_153948 [Monoraphidium minutum]